MNDRVYSLKFSMTVTTMFTCVLALSDINLIRSMAGTKSNALILILICLFLLQIKKYSPQITFSRKSENFHGQRHIGFAAPPTTSGKTTHFDLKVDNSRYFGPRYIGDDFYLGANLVSFHSIELSFLYSSYRSLRNRKR